MNMHMKVIHPRASGCYWTHELSEPRPKAVISPRPSILNVKVRHETRFTIVELRGRLDSSLDQKLLAQLGELITQGKVSIIVDARHLEFLNSRGVSVFLAVIDDLRAWGGDLKFAGLNKQSAFVLDRLGLSRIIQTFDSVEQAGAVFETPIG